MLAHANRPENRAIGSPGGGGIASAADVALFYQGLLADAADRGAGIWQAAMLREAWTPRNTELIDPMTKQPALRGLGVVIAGERDPMWRGFAEACSPQTFGHMGAGGQIAWADPVSGLSFAFCTNGAERNPVRQGANGLRLSTLAAACLALGSGDPRTLPVRDTERKPRAERADRGDAARRPSTRPSRTRAASAASRTSGLG